MEEGDLWPGPLSCSRGHCFSQWPKAFISFGLSGYSQSRSNPSNPNLRATSIVESMKFDSEDGFETMLAKMSDSALSPPPPPMDRRVFTAEFCGGGLW